MRLLRFGGLGAFEANVSFDDDAAQARNAPLPSPRGKENFCYDAPKESVSAYYLLQ